MRLSLPDMEYQVLYTNGRDVSACEYVTARSHMEAWSKGSARAQGRERVLHVFLCHDDFDPDVDATPEEYLDGLKQLTYDELVEETSTDDTFTLSEFMQAYG